MVRARAIAEGCDIPESFLARIHEASPTSPALAEAFTSVRRARSALLDRVTVAQMAERDARG